MRRYSRRESIAGATLGCMAQVSGWLWWHEKLVCLPQVRFATRLAAHEFGTNPQYSATWNETFTTTPGNKFRGEPDTKFLSISCSVTVTERDVGTVGIPINAGKKAQARSDEQTLDSHSLSPPTGDLSGSEGAPI